MARPSSQKGKRKSRSQKQQQPKQTPLNLDPRNSPNPPPPSQFGNGHNYSAASTAEDSHRLASKKTAAAANVEPNVPPPPPPLTSNSEMHFTAFNGEQSKQLRQAQAALFKSQHETLAQLSSTFAGIDQKLTSVLATLKALSEQAETVVSEAKTSVAQVTETLAEMSQLATSVRTDRAEAERASASARQSEQAMERTVGKMTSSCAALKSASEELEAFKERLAAVKYVGNSSISKADNGPSGPATLGEPYKSLAQKSMAAFRDEALDIKNAAHARLAMSRNSTLLSKNIPGAGAQATSTYSPSSALQAGRLAGVTATSQVKSAPKQDSQLVRLSTSGSEKIIRIAEQFESDDDDEDSASTTAAPKGTSILAKAAAKQHTTSVNAGEHDDEQHSMNTDEQDEYEFTEDEQQTNSPAAASGGSLTRRPRGTKRARTPSPSQSGSSARGGEPSPSGDDNQAPTATTADNDSDASSESNADWAIEAILDAKTVSGLPKYLVMWDDERHTINWIEESKLVDSASSLLATFKRHMDEFAHQHWPAPTPNMNAIDFAGESELMRDKLDDVLHLTGSYHDRVQEVIAGLARLERTAYYGRFPAKVARGKLTTRLIFACSKLERHLQQKPEEEEEQDGGQSDDYEQALDDWENGSDQAYGLKDYLILIDWLLQKIEHH